MRSAGKHYGAQSLDFRWKIGMQLAQPALQGGAPICRILFRMAGFGGVGRKPNAAPADILGMRVNERKFERTRAEVNTEEEAHNGLYRMPGPHAEKKRSHKGVIKKGARQAGAP